MTENFIGPIDSKDIMARLIRLETKVCLKFEEMEKALVIARELVEKDKILARESVNTHFEQINQFQKRMDKLESSFATKPDVQKEVDAAAGKLAGEVTALSLLIHSVKDSLDVQINALKRLVYIGVGIAISLQFMARFLLPKVGM
jgi:hypothetical protein